MNCLHVEMVHTPSPDEGFEVLEDPGAEGTKAATLTAPIIRNKKLVRISETVVLVQLL